MIPVAKYGEIKGGCLAFMLRRAKRILPPYYAALLIAIVVDKYTGFMGAPAQFSREVIGHLFLLHDVNTAYWVQSMEGVLGPLWSIAIEWHAYFLFPVYFWLFQKCGAVKATVFIALAWYAAQALGVHSPITLSLVWLYWLFALGMCASYLCFSPDKEAVKLRALPWTPITLGMTPVGALGAYLFLKGIGSTFVADSAVGLLAAAVMISFALNESKLKALICQPILVWIGTWSYSLYLIHWCLLDIRCKFFPGTSMLAFIPFALLSGYLFHLAFEKPFMTTTKRVPSEAKPAELPGIVAST